MGGWRMRLHVCATYRPVTPSESSWPSLLWKANFPKVLEVLCLTDRDVVTFFFDRQRMWPSDVKHSLRGDTEPSRTHTNSPPHNVCQTSRCPLWDERA